MAQRYQGRHRRPTRKLPVAAVARPAMAIGAAAAVSLGMAAPAQAHTGEHAVRAGDSLGGLAVSHGTSWQAIYADNRGSIGADPNVLRVGQVLAVGGAAPAPPAPPVPATASGEYVVQAGDTLGGIAARHGTTWEQLHALNGAVIGADPNALRVGQRLTLGGAVAPAAATPPRAVAERASRGSERAGIVDVAATADADAPTPSSTSYGSWAPHVRPVVQEVTDRFGVSTVLTRPGHSPTQELAADFMVHTDMGKGDAVAQYLVDNASRFRVEYVIWNQRIYLPSSGSWRAMEDRGSPTANHVDHPHVSFLPAG